MFPLVMLAIGALCFMGLAAILVGRVLHAIGSRHRQWKAAGIKGSSCDLISSARPRRSSADPEAFKRWLDRKHAELDQPDRPVGACIGPDGTSRSSELCRNCQQPLALPSQGCNVHLAVGVLVEASRTRPKEVPPPPVPPEVK